MNETAIVRSEAEVNFELAQREAKALAASSLIPTHFQGKVADCMIALNLAKRLNSDPLMVCQNIYVVHGRPALSSSFLIATVNACGRFTPLRFRFEGEAGKPNYGCRAVATDRESGEECEGTLITLKMAADEGWSTKKGSKWKTMTEQMLRYRAAAFWARTYAPDATMGIYTREEIHDIGHATVTARSGALRSFLATKKDGETVDADGVVDVTDEPVSPSLRAFDAAVARWGDEGEDRFHALCEELGIDAENMTDEQADKLTGMIGVEKVEKKEI